MRRTLWRWLADANGDDLVEYALLASFVGLIGVAAYNALGSNMNLLYAAWDNAMQDLWEVDDPQP